LDGNHVFALPSCIASFHLPSPRMGSACIAFVLLWKERNLVEVGTFQPSLELQGFSSGSPAAFPHQWEIWWREASRAVASAPPSASRIFIIRAEVEERTERGVTSTWVGNPFLPPVFGGERRPPAPQRLPSAMPGKANCCCPARVQHFVLCPSDGRTTYGPTTSRSSLRRQPGQRVA
jgi:hypothetical protein